MKESDLYAPVRDWLTARGYTIHVEVFDADIVATKDGKLTAVELKPCLTNGLFCQCVTRAKWADEVIAAIASDPRGTGGMKQHGFGLLQVVNGKVRVRVHPKPQPWYWHKMRAYRMKKLANRAPAMPHEVAGLPSCPALKDQRRQREAKP
jgi:hypothetical protein